MKHCNTPTILFSTAALMTVAVSSFQMPFALSSTSLRIQMSEDGAEKIKIPDEELSTEKKNRIIQDPMGLYSKNSDERRNGQIESIEAEIPEPNAIYDPLNLYSTNSKERTEGDIKSIEPELVVTKAVVDPMGLYNSEADVDSDAIMSQALPFATRPLMLTGELPGDVGFDPLGFAKTQEDLMNYREAEIKHARLAMLAAAGWPLSEVFDKKIAGFLHMTALVDASDRAPSVLNGGLGKVNPFYWMACLLAGSAIEFYGISRSKSGDASYFPGNLGFDPLSLYPQDEEGQKRMQLAEIKNGRLAMIAIFGFAIQEFISKIGVVDETPFFFLPISETMKIMENSGYIQ